MKKKLLTLTFLALLNCMAFSQIVYEDFEGGAKLTWEALNGTYAGQITNPDPNAINMSTDCGSYTKSDMHAYSLFLATLDNPIDLSSMNQFKVQVYSPAATRILLKLEGTGEAIEATKNIANKDVWQEYTFDFSAAASFTTITKIILFFDPGVDASGDTYLFDNIVATAAGACAGTTADAAIIDDFECQRNASYAAGWDILQAVANPNSSGINTSSMVGQYEDPLDQWSALVVDYNSPIDLSTSNNIKAKIWAPKTGKMLFKLEGGVSSAAEIFIDITEANTWVEYNADFSGQSNANHERISIFFNAGVTAEAGDIYYIDDISFGEAPPASALEDFENGANLTWEPLNSDMTNHGSFDGVQSNPDQGGINVSDNVGKYTKGNAAFSTLSAFLPNGLDLSASPQINLHVRAPAGSENVTMQLVSPTQGNKDVTRDISATEEWVLLEFNFEEFDDVSDFERVNLLFDGGTAAQGTSYMFDNLAQSVSTVDPCEGVVAIPTILDDYECQRNVTYGAGGNRLKPADNPKVSSGNTSTTVGEYKDPTDEWSALGFESGSSWDLAVFNQFHIKIYSTLKVPVLFKLEGGSSPAVEVWSDITEVDKWVEYTVDFGDHAQEDHARIVVFFNGGQLPTAEDLYYIDDVSWARLNYSGCINDYESFNSSITNYQYFANGHIEQENNKVAIVDNPNKSGINDSEKVGKFVKANDGTTFSGAFAHLGAPLEFGENKTIKVKVLMDHIGNFGMKVEGSTTGASAIELAVDNTLVNEWEELTFDFSAVGDDANYQTLTIFVDLNIEPAATDVTSYFDDFIIGDGTCPFMTTGIFEIIEIEKFKISPNPVSHQLLIENTAEIETIEVFNLWGQKIRTIKLIGADTFELHVNHLENGMYLIAGYNKTGQLVANAKFIKGI